MRKTTTLVCTMLAALILTTAALVWNQGLSPRPVQARSLDRTELTTAAHASKQQGTTTAAPVSKQRSSQRTAQANSINLTVTVDCQSNPETTKVTNDSNQSVTIKTVGSIDQPRSDEPFTVNETLGAGQSITFESGFGANQHVLTHEFIYDNEAGSQEGAKVVTSTGDSVTDRCGGSGTSGQTNHSAGAAGRGSAADHQYNREGSINNHGGVIPGSIPKRPLPFTGGPPLFEAFIVVGLIGAGLLLLRRT